MVEELPSGEPAKVLEQQEVILRRLAALRLDRGDPVVAIGDEALLEAATFSAAVWLRGVPLVVVPVTTLGLIDTSIGGKGGINVPGTGRNILGAFHQPIATILDVELVDDESAADRRSALSEAVKYGLIGHEGILSLLETGEGRVGDLPWPRGADLLKLVERCVLVKRSIVLHDERDAGDVRIALNLGHTVSHALEAATGLPHAPWRGGCIRPARCVGDRPVHARDPAGHRDSREPRASSIGSILAARRSTSGWMMSWVTSKRTRSEAAAGFAGSWSTGSGPVVRDDVPQHVVRAAVTAALEILPPSRRPPGSSRLSGLSNLRGAARRAPTAEGGVAAQSRTTRWSTTRGRDSSAAVTASPDDVLWNVVANDGADPVDQDPAKPAAASLLVRLDVTQDIIHPDVERRAAKIEPIEDTSGSREGGGRRGHVHGQADLQRSAQAVSATASPWRMQWPRRGLERVTHRMSEVQGNSDVTGVPLVMQHYAPLHENASLDELKQIRAPRGQGRSPTRPSPVSRRDRCPHGR